MLQQLRHAGKVEILIGPQKLTFFETVHFLFRATFRDITNSYLCCCHCFVNPPGMKTGFILCRKEEWEDSRQTVIICISLIARFLISFEIAVCRVGCLSLRQRASIIQSQMSQQFSIVVERLACLLSRHSQ